MKNKVCGLLVLGLLTSGTYASAAEFVVAPAVDLSYKSSDFTLEFFGGTGVSLVKPSYTTLTPSLALSYGRFYGVVSYESTINDWNSMTLELGGGGANTITYDTFERNEASLTVGYRLVEGGNRFGAVNLFVGYLLGDSAWRSLRIATDSANVVAVNTINGDFRENGFFIGANYTHPFGNKGSLSLSAAYGLLDGVLNDVETGDTASLTNQDLSSESRGLSFGVAWSGTLAGNLNYRVGLKYINYKFDVNSIEDKIAGTTSSVTPGQFVIKESIYSLFFGVVNYF